MFSLMAMRRSGSPVTEIECDVFTSVTLATNEDGGYVALMCTREIQLSISTISDLAYSVPLLQKPWVEVVQ
jgi:hypothetical protein